MSVRSYPPAPPTAGLLGRLPKITQVASYVRYLRPWRLDAIAEIFLRNYASHGKALQLIKTHFPQLFEAEIYDLSDLYSAISTFLHAVDDQFFPIDWEYVDDLWRLSQEIGDYEEGLEPEFLTVMTGIPLKCFMPFDPFLCYDDPDERWVQNRIVTLLYSLMCEDGELPSQVSESDWFDGDFDRQDFYEAITVYDSRNDPEPFCYLSEIAALLTIDNPYKNNPFLDVMGREMGEAPIDYYSWEKDIPKLKEQWVAAKPLTEKMEKFNNFLADSIGLNQTLAFLWSLYHEQHRPKPAPSPVTESAYLVDVFNDGRANSGLGE